MRIFDMSEKGKEEKTVPPPPIEEVHVRVARADNVWQSFIEDLMKRRDKAMGGGL
jgi:hypothetical protein